MSNIVMFNPVATPQRVLTVIANANTEDFGQQVAGVFVPNTGVVVDPDLSALDSVPQNYWKHVAGSIVEYTAAEKATQDTAEAVAETAKVRTDANGRLSRFQSEGLLLRAIVSILRDLINIERAEHGRAAITMAQIRAQILGRVNDGSVDS